MNTRETNKASYACTQTHTQKKKKHSSLQKKDSQWLLLIKTKINRNHTAPNATWTWNISQTIRNYEPGNNNLTKNDAIPYWYNLWGYDHVSSMTLCKSYMQVLENNEVSIHRKPNFKFRKEPAWSSIPPSNSIECSHKNEMKSSTIHSSNVKHAITTRNMIPRYSHILPTKAIFQVLH